MSQKQAISQTPIDLKPEDEAKEKVSGGNAPEKNSAVQGSDARPPANRDGQQPGPRGGQPRRMQADSEDNTVHISSNAPARSGGAKRVAARPANDDMPSIGGLIYALQQRPSRSPFLIALVASGVWFALGMLVSWAVFQKSFDGAETTADMIANPAVFGVVATVVIPIALFWFLAILVWRAQELRLMSSAMTEVAVRLAEPDRMAEQSVASLGQTVRRQVAAMNDAISRALGRAGELEALVHNEVAALERSYTENENRIRNLINELASEREALANNSERVSEALRGIGTQVTREITAASEKATQSLGHASNTMSEAFATRGQKITAAVTAAGVAIDEKLAERGARITDQLTKHGAQAAEALRISSLEVTRAIQETSDRTAAAISAKGNSLVTSVIGMSERVGREIPVLLEKLGTEQTRLSGIIDGATRNLAALETALAEKTQSLDATLTDKTSVLQTVLSEHSRSIDTTLAERIQGLETILSRRTHNFEVNLSERAKQLDQALAARTQALETSVGKHSTNIRETLDKHSGSMEHMLARQASSIERAVTSSSVNIQRAVEELAVRSNSGSEALTNQARVLKEVSANLVSQLGGLTKRFEDQGNALATASRTFEMSNAKVDTMMEHRQVAFTKLMETLSTRATELDRMMNSYSNMLEQSLSQAELRARKVTELLAKDSAEKSQVAIREIERLRVDAQEHTQKAVSELQANFTSLSDQVSSQLTALSSKFSDTTRVVRDNTRRATVDLETAQNELQRHAKGLPETAKQSAGAMRRALQDQLSALDALSDLANRHAYSSAVSTPDRREPVQQQQLPPQQQQDPSFGAQRQGYDFGQPPSEKALWPEQPPARQALPDPVPVPPQPQPQPVQTVYQEPPAAERRGSWSLGDLLARASEDDGSFFDKDEQAGLPGSFAPRPAAAPQAADFSSDFTMGDIAACIDERRVMEVWQRLKRGETEILKQRGFYNRQAQGVVDRVLRRYETDKTFRSIVERYLGDFEKMLQDLSRSDPRGGSVQSRLASEEGRIYFVLSHISGRLGG
ncbi:hypothetical protein Rvan_0447 [Rhodomicrobium vannielii ATCC 17100]|uniref:Apolipoprotein A1/A4/E n=1 Tax=Rhodomicrobium vannielii (strain ATCC 17100 / DSM 162 / LMG 4299 / NCIMB 10020 / ATH 3.1.1) TaxID=648757 RepID=E3I8A4_RHOVT|nr:hypothetical protein [Rhodomicrobium vannielii]ADP69729.1 hypothetical protein Rvan_0447 [Rhodomicrobium vannielii ATCC 17100]